MIENKSASSDQHKIKVIYLAGTARSGSTFLGNLISGEKDFINVGELRYIWDRGIIDNWQCTCVENFKDCSFWRKILDYLSIRHRDLSEVHSTISDRGISKNREFRIRNTILNSSRKIQKDISNNKEYKLLLDDLYSGIKKYSTTTYILDSSKDAIYAEFFSQVKNIELHIIHIVRDPRSVVYSQVFNRKTQIVDQNRSFTMGTSLSKSVFSWYHQNYLIEKLHSNKENYFRIKYEDIIADSDRNKLKLVFDKLKEWGFTNSAKSKQNHAFSGNPVRFSKNNSDTSAKKKKTKAQYI